MQSYALPVRAVPWHWISSHILCTRSPLRETVAETLPPAVTLPLNVCSMDSVAKFVWRLCIDLKGDLRVDRDVLVLRALRDDLHETSGHGSEGVTGGGGYGGTKG